MLYVYLNMKYKILKLNIKIFDVVNWVYIQDSVVASFI